MGETELTLPRDESVVTAPARTGCADAGHDIDGPPAPRRRVYADDGGKLPTTSVTAFIQALRPTVSRHVPVRADRPAPCLLRAACSAPGLLRVVIPRRCERPTANAASVP